MAEDVVNLILSDHRAVVEMVAQVQAAPERRAELLSSLASMLVAHIRAEEETVYPVLRYPNSGDEGVPDPVERSGGEHQQVEQLLDDVTALPADSGEFDETFAALTAAVRCHVDEQESQLLPKLREQLDPDGLAELGEAFSRRRYQELQITDL